MFRYIHKENKNSYHTKSKRIKIKYTHFTNCSPGSQWHRGFVYIYFLAFYFTSSSCPGAHWFWVVARCSACIATQKKRFSSCTGLSSFFPQRFAFCPLVMACVIASKRIIKGSREDPERIPRWSREDPERIPRPSFTFLLLILSFPPLLFFLSFHLSASVPL